MYLGYGIIEANEEFCGDSSIAFSQHEYDESDEQFAKENENHRINSVKGLEKSSEILKFLKIKEWFSFNTTAMKMFQAHDLCANRFIAKGGHLQRLMSGELYASWEWRAKISMSCRTALQDCPHVQAHLFDLVIDDYIFMLYEYIPLTNTIESVMKFPWTFIEFMRQLISAYDYIHRHNIRKSFVYNFLFYVHNIF